METSTNLTTDPIFRFTLPSLRRIGTRENNGDDEETLSKISNAVGNKNIQAYLASTIVEDSDIRPTDLTPVDHIRKMKRADAYYTMFKQRILNLGSTLIFKDGCDMPNCKHITEYELDCSEYDRDLSLKDIPRGFPTSGVYPYPLAGEPSVTHTLSSGKKIQFDILTLEGEENMLQTPLENRSNNTMFYGRNLRIWDKDRWRICYQMTEFKSSDMRELRGLVDKYDADFAPYADVVCEKCRNPKRVKLLQLDDFFYPAERIV